MLAQFEQQGWVQFPSDPEILKWLNHARPNALASLNDPAHQDWMDCEGTWFIGVDALDNDALGRVGGSEPLSGQAMRFIDQHLQRLPLHKGQVSVIYPGYPRPRKMETDAAGRYRAKRDAAHVDGIKPMGPNRERMVDEPHAWVLGISLSDASADAAPLVVWEGSHTIMGEALAAVLRQQTAGANLAQVDITEAYQAARRVVFDTCRRVELPISPGETYVMHRHLLHGVAPWGADAQAAPEGRMIAYFRPELPGGVADWI
jgi:hypothetical protein